MHSTSSAPPNILFFICDDLGYGDLSCTGNPHTDTPHLARLKAEGCSLENYLSGPLCTPARAALMTGRHPYRTRALDTYLGRSMIDPDEITLAQLLKGVGYATGLFGKWHLGDNYPMRPQDMGFDEVVMHGGGGLRQPANPGRDSYFDPELFHNGSLQRYEGYCSDIFVDEAIAFMRNHQAGIGGKPFFAYVGFNAPHTPVEVDEAHVRKFREKGLPERFSRIYGMVENIDANVGRALSALDELGLSQNTLVVFTSDHGPCGSARDAGGNTRFNAGLRGIKGTFYQGGIKVPCFIRWPEALSRGRNCLSLSNPIDWVPTFSEITGFPLPSGRVIDGKSLFPALSGASEEGDEDRLLCMQWHRGNEPVLFRNYTTIGRRFKLVQNSEKEACELYDLENDPSEERNVAAEHPHMVSRYKEEYVRWFSDVSTTRTDNYAPPRIVVGTRKGDPVYLTWQDWRPYSGEEGWAMDNPGYWEVSLEKHGAYKLQIDVLPLEKPCMLILRCGDWEEMISVPETSGAGFPSLVSYSISTPALPAGNNRLEAFLAVDGSRHGIIRARMNALNDR